ncbi:Translation initiation factor 3 subunit c, partial [Coemansia spiralis]
MSRFFRSAQDSDSDSELSSSSGSEYSDDGLQQKPAAASGNRFARAGFGSDDDSDDDVKRVMKTPKEKYTDETVALSAAVLGAVRTDKWSAVATDVEKLKGVVLKLGAVLRGESLPRIYIRCIAKVEDRTVVGGMSKEQLGKLNAVDARAFNKLKQRMRDYTTPIAKQLAEYRANPVDSADDEQPQADAESDDDDEQAVPAPAARKARKAPAARRAPAAGSGSDSGDSYWGSESDESESSSESEGERRVGFARWLKKTPTKDEGSAKSSRKERSQRAAQASAAAAAAAAAAGDEDEDDGFTAVGKGGKAVQKPAVTAETLNKNLKAILDARGRKSTDKKGTIRQLEALLGVAANSLQKCKVLLALVSAQFDDASGTPTANYMAVEQWSRAQASLNELLATLEANSQITIAESAEVHTEDSDIAYAGEVIALNGSIVGLVERLDDEFDRSLQQIDPHTPDYIGRMRDSVPLYATIVRSQRYFERCALKDSLCRAVVRRLEHLYYRTDQVNRQVEEAAAGQPAEPAASPEDTIQQLCSFLYQNADPALRVRA